MSDYSSYKYSIHTCVKTCLIPRKMEMKTNRTIQTIAMVEVNFRASMVLILRMGKRMRRHSTIATHYR